jgi:hypothetical protein
MNPNLARALQAAVLHTDDNLYSIIHLPPRAITPAAAIVAEHAEPFSAVMVDKDEVTLIISEAGLEAFTNRIPDHAVSRGFRLITFDVMLDHTLIGFMSTISGHLAAAGIPIMIYSAFERDHLLVHDTHFGQAMAALEGLLKEARED